jgi:hypothetical protein
LPSSFGVTLIWVVASAMPLRIGGGAARL